MKPVFKQQWIWAVAVSACTLVSYAQFSNPADDVPAYHPRLRCMSQRSRPSWLEPS